MPEHAQTIKAGILYQTRAIDKAAVKEDRTVELSFSSEQPVERWFGTETLDHGQASVDLTRLNNGGALLVEHDPSKQVGVVETANIGADRMGRAKVRFGTSSFANEVFEDVKSGIRRLVSVGYRIRNMVLEKEEDGVEHYRATSWMPLELSIVAVPADATVGVGRTGNTDEQEISIINRNMKILLEAQPAGGGGTTPPAPPPTPEKPPSASILREATRKAREDEQTRIREINAIAEKLNHSEVTELAEEAIRGDMSIDEFRAKVLETGAFNAKPVSSTETGLLGMSDKEVEEYSLVRAIHRRAENRQLDGIEREASDALAKRIKRNPMGFFVPADVAIRGFADSKRLNQNQRQYVMEQVRALTSNVHSAGGALVGTDLMGSSLIELLRNAMFVMQMGARSITGLVGDVAIPRQTGGATAYWLGQGAALTRTQQVVDQLALTPHRLAAATAYDKQLLAQSSTSVEAFVREDLTAILALEKDRVALAGTGTAGEPLGILNTTGLSTPVTFSTAASPLFTEMIKFETNLAANNADRGRLGYLTTPAVRGFLKGWPKFASTGTPIWENNQVNGYIALATNQVPTATSVIFGRWDDLIIADWDGLDVVVDPYSLSLNGQISVVIQTLTDIGIRHPKSFAKATN